MGSVPQDCFLLQMLIPRSRSLGAYNFWLTWLQTRDSRDLFLDFNYLLKEPTELREVLMSSSFFYHKGYKSYPDEEMHRVRCGRVPRAGASVPVELGCENLLACWVGPKVCLGFSLTSCKNLNKLFGQANTYDCQPRNSPITVLVGFLWKFHHIGIIDH